MSSTLNRPAWKKMLDEDLVWLEALPGHAGPSTEKGHVIEIVKMLRESSPAALNEFMAGQRAERATERHLDKVDPDRTKSRRYRELRDELSLRLSFAGPDPDPAGRAVLRARIADLELELIPTPEEASP